MPRRRNRGTSRFRKQRGNKIWTASKLDQVDTLSTPLGVELVGDGDLGAHEQATIQGVYGWLDAVPQSTLSVDDSVMCLIVLQDEDIGITSTAHDPDDVASYVDNDILWCGGASFASVATETVRIPFHILRRKMTRQQHLLFIHTNNGGSGNIAISGVLRTILVLP